MLEVSGWLVKLSQVGGIDGIGDGRVDVGQAVGNEVQGDSVFKKMTQPHEQLFFLNYQKMEM